MLRRVLTVAVLGPVEVQRDGAVLVIPAGKTTELLIRLALEGGVVVRADRLADDLWGEARVERNTLQAKVSRLRRALGDPVLVPGSKVGYALAVSPADVDALQVLELASSAAELRRSGELDEAMRTCASALALFRGEILPSAGQGDWLAPFRSRLEETRLRLTIDHVGARLDRGPAEEIVPELEALVSQHPLAEDLWLLLITALYRAGRQADALGAYRRIRQLLADELGLDPGPKLGVLEEQILRHDPRLADHAGRMSRTSSRPGRDENAIADLIGREADLDAVLRLLGETQMVTVVGAAGVGKTRLAVEVANVGPGNSGAWLVRLEHAHTAGAVWETIGNTFDVASANEQAVVDRLAGSNVLLVLDNCEHLIEILPPVVERLLGIAPALRMLATSQVRLGIADETVIGLEPLGLADAMRLFTRRATEQRKSSVETPDAAATIERICRSLDGLPLALELAAARAKVLSVADIDRRLANRFALLSDPTDRRPARQRSLALALTWTYELLFPDDQLGWCALACFSGGASLPALEAVLGAIGVPATSAVDVLVRLADRSLVVVDTDAGGEVRYRLLESVREFGLDRLAEGGLTEAARSAHASWYADAADRAAARSRTSEQVEYVVFLRTERTNVDAALSWCAASDPLLGLRIAVGFGWTWVVLGAGVEAARRVRHALAAASSLVTPQDRVRALLLTGWLEASGGDLDLATDDLNEVLRIGNERQRAEAQLHLAFVCSQLGRADEAGALLETCRSVFSQHDLRWEEAASWVLTAWAEITVGQTERAAEACRQALRLLEPIGDRWGTIHADAMLGALAQVEQRYVAAITHLHDAATAAHELGFVAAEAHHLANLGHAQQQAGDASSAVATYEAAIAVARSCGDGRTAALAEARLASVCRSVGQTTRAQTLAEAAQRWYRAAGGGEGLALADEVLAALDEDRTDLDSVSDLTSTTTSNRSR
jgi:predicted ATPase/DNA-binding SARP family transcriptional activator